MAPQAAFDQHIDLALEQLVQPRRLTYACSDLRLSPAKLREPRPQVVHVNAAMHSNMQQARGALGFELGGCIGDQFRFGESDQPRGRRHDGQRQRDVYVARNHTGAERPGVP